jgi:hypothetical protein
MVSRAGVAVLLLGLALPAAAASTFSSVLNDIELRPEVGTGIYGDELTGNLGIQSLGLRDFDRRWLLSWNGDAELVLGGVAYENPYDWAYGAQGEAHGEGGFRILPNRPISPYVSAGLDASLSAVTEFGIPFDRVQLVNNLDGFGGVVGLADVRLGLGASFLGPRQSLIIEAQPLAEVDSAEANLPLLPYLGGALHARYDRRDSFVAIGEVYYAVTPAQNDAALGTSSVTGRWILSANALKKFGRHFFGGLGLSVSRAATQLAYSTGQSYTSDTPVDTRLWLLFGYWP